jgi:hypothetical protein
VNTVLAAREVAAVFPCAAAARNCQTRSGSF